METNLDNRVVVLAQLTLAVPAIAAVLLIAYYCWYMFGPMMIPYYLAAGVLIAWQWYSLILPCWNDWFKKRGAEKVEAHGIDPDVSLAWPGASTVGLFALHTTAASMCGLHIGPRIVARWFAWVLPLLGLSTTTYAVDYYLQHLELVSIIPAFLLGFLVSYRFPRLATWAWILPTVILAYKLLAFETPPTSVLASSPSLASSLLSRFSYFFVIERYMPTFTNFRGSDPVRVAQQMTVVATLYSGVAYSIGALAQKHKIVQRLFGKPLTEPNPAPE